MGLVTLGFSKPSLENSLVSMRILLKNRCLYIHKHLMPQPRCPIYAFEKPADEEAQEEEEASQEGKTEGEGGDADLTLHTSASQSNCCASFPCGLGTRRHSRFVELARGLCRTRKGELAGMMLQRLSPGHLSGLQKVAKSGVDRVQTATCDMMRESRVRAEHARGVGTGVR
nr:hypothetical protein CFP56_28811 [Quercus suber]